MQIHIVSKNDSLYTIAHTYGTTVDDLIQSNQLETPNDLVIGQALVIPIVGQFYFLKHGESLYNVAEKFHISAEQLAAINHVSLNQPLHEGFRIYIPPAEKGEIRSIAYIEPFQDPVPQTLENAAKRATPLLTHLVPFSFQVERDGSIHPPPLNNFQEIAQQNGASLTLAITNLEDGAFSDELGHIILTVQAVQDRLIDHLVNTAIQGNFSNIHIDFEFLLPEDRLSYVEFLKRLKSHLENRNIQLSVALAPKTSASQIGQWYEAHDYKAIAEVVDFVVLMTYEWGYSGGPPMAVSPISEVRKVIDYALTEIPKEKILLGQNLYGYDWTLPFQQGDMARAISPQEAIQIARINNAQIEFDETAQAPFFTYYDASGHQHEVWFEDARSIQAKFQLIKEKQLRGIAYWKLGISFPQNWLLLQDEFNIIKNE